MVIKNQYHLITIMMNCRFYADIVKKKKEKEKWINKIIFKKLMLIPNNLKFLCSNDPPFEY